MWNLDAVPYGLEHFQEVGRKIRSVYAAAYPDVGPLLPDDNAVNRFVEELHVCHPTLAPVRFWRVLTTATIRRLDDVVEGTVRPTKQTYRNVMEVLRES